MDPVNFGASLSIVRDLLPFFVCLLFGLPIVSFIVIKFWIARHSTKMQHTANWFVPTDLESESAKMHYALLHNSAEFARRFHRKSRHTVDPEDPDSSRRA